MSTRDREPKAMADRKKLLIVRSDGGDRDAGEELLAMAGEPLERALTSALSNREHVVMVRVNADVLEKLHLLVESGICKSRSSAAAFVLSEGIQANTDFFASIEEATRKMTELKRDLLSRARPASGSAPEAAE